MLSFIGDFTKNDEIHENERVEGERVDTTDKISQIMKIHGLSSREEARRWLRERIDVKYRTRSKGKRSRKNPERRLVDALGHTLTPEIQTKWPDYVVPGHDDHVPQPGSLFERALAAREADRTPRRVKSGQSKTDKRKIVRKSPPTRQDRPRPGTKAEICYLALIERDWDKKRVIDHLIATHPDFTCYHDTFPTVYNVHQRYGPKEAA